MADFKIGYRTAYTFHNVIELTGDYEEAQCVANHLGFMENIFGDYNSRFVGRRTIETIDESQTEEG